MDSKVKEEIVEAGEPLGGAPGPSGRAAVVIELSSSDSEDERYEGGSGKGYRASSGGPTKRLKGEGAALPLGFLDPFTPEEMPAPLPSLPEPMSAARSMPAGIQGSRQFWKAGDYEGSSVADPTPFSGGMDHVRVHPKFLHSNATSHKWALGAFAELLDNSLDEVCNGATYVNVDMLVNKKDGTRMLLVEDNGGGMDPDKMRQCISLGYSAKSKIANTIGQYGNGFKTSTMRLGADVVVFSRSRGKGQSPTQSIGMLSYTFLKNTGKEDIVVPMLDYEKVGNVWNRMARSSSLDWNANLETILQWSPYTSEAELLQQFSTMANQGTRIVIYSLWEDDQGELELDFEADKHDIQLRGVNRDEKKIQMAKQFPNSRHFLTYRNSLRSYTSILYLRLPSFFRIILRGKEIEHHNIVNDMMLKQEVTYRPQPVADGVPKDPNMVAVVTIGFVKDAKDHIDIQGFNVYHKNRLIKPFWRVWNASGSDGRGVIGLLEANFVEPAHDKQGFERTTVLARLETRLIQMQKTYWTTKCHKIGYAPRCSKKHIDSEDRESSPEAYRPSSQRSRKNASPSSVSPVSKSQYSSKVHYTEKSSSDSNRKMGKASTPSSKDAKMKSDKKFDINIRSTQSSSHGTPDSSDESNADIEFTPTVKFVNESGGSKASVAQKAFQKENGHPTFSKPLYSVNNRTGENHALNGCVEIDRMATRSHSKVDTVTCNGNGSTLVDSELSIRQMTDENEALKDRLMKMEESMLIELQHERDKIKSLTEQLQEAQEKLEEANKEQEALIDIFSEERNRRDREEENLRKKLKDASVTIQELLDKLSSSRS